MTKNTVRGGYGQRDSPFFRLRSRRKLAKLLHVSPNELRSISRDNQLYKRRWKEKKGSRWFKYEPTDKSDLEYRSIDIPDPRLKRIQSRIAVLFGRISPPDYLFSPVKRRSYVDNAAYHLGSIAFWFLDVKDYFPSCTANNVARLFRHDLQCSLDVTAILVHLTTNNKHLPQGSPCSPILAFYSNYAMWEEISELVIGENCRWSLYADDITISGSLVPKKMIWRVKQILHRNGFRSKSSKEVSLIRVPAEITGVIVGDGTRLPNRQLKRLAELKAARRSVTDPDLRRVLDLQIAGRNAQRRQVEGG